MTRDSWRQLQGLCTGSEFLLVLSVIYVRWDDTLPLISVALWLSLGKLLCSHVNEIYAVVFGEQPQLKVHPLLAICSALISFLYRALHYPWREIKAANNLQITRITRSKKRKRGCWGKRKNYSLLASLFSTGIACSNTGHRPWVRYEVRNASHFKETRSCTSLSDAVTDTH